MAFDRKAYYQRTRAKQLETAAKWRLENKERHAQATSKSARGRKYRDPIGYLLEKTKARAKANGVDFTLTRDDVTIPEMCPILDIPLFFADGSNKDKNPNSPSIDRLDPSKGYTKDNIVICSWRANHLKNDGHLEEFEKLVKFLAGIP